MEGQSHKPFWEREVREAMNRGPAGGNANGYHSGFPERSRRPYSGRSSQRERARRRNAEDLGLSDEYYSRGRRRPRRPGTAATASHRPRNHQSHHQQPQQPAHLCSTKPSARHPRSRRRSRLRARRRSRIPPSLRSATTQGKCHRSSNLPPPRRSRNPDALPAGHCSAGRGV